MGVRRDYARHAVELDATYHITQATPIIFVFATVNHRPHHRFCRRTHSSLDVATGCSFEVCVNFVKAKELSAHSSFVGLRHFTFVRTPCSHGDHRQIIRDNAARSRTRCSSQRTVPTSCRHSLRPARPRPSRHQISTKNVQRRKRSIRTNDHPTKTTNTSTRPRTHRQAQVSPRPS